MEYEDDDDIDGVECTCEECSPPAELITSLKLQFFDNVKKGAYLLDEQFPGWRQQIQLQQLDLSCGISCVLGQLYGSYGEGIGHLNIRNTAENYGFTISSNETPPISGSYWPYWKALDQLWTEFIEQDFQDLR